MEEYPGRANIFESPFDCAARGSYSDKYFNQPKVHKNLVSEFPGYKDYPGWWQRETNVSEKIGGKSTSIYQEEFQSSPLSKKSKQSVRFAGSVHVR